MTERTENGGERSPQRTESGDEENIQSPQFELQAEEEFEWTSEQMLEAEPLPVPEFTEQEIEQFEEMRSTILGEAEGDITTEKGGLPDSATGSNGADTLATRGGYNYHGPYTRYEVFDEYTVYPYVTVGKLFFRRGSRRIVCSAASIGNYAILTAGHCVHSGNGQASGWSRDVVFVPAYKDGNAPLGQWRAARLFTKTAWFRNGDLSQDIGGAVLHPRGGRKISEVVGWLGFAWNFTNPEHWDQLGYPAASPFNGQRLIQCQSSFAYNGHVSSTKAVGNDMTGGSSGGPWVLRFGRGNYLNGLNSYRLRTRPEEMNSPHFDDRAKSLKDLLVISTP